MKNHLDFLGINYYFHRKIKFPFKITEEGGGCFLTWVGKYFRKEFIMLLLKRVVIGDRYITENGLADEKNEKRKKFIKDHLVWEAQSDKGWL